MNTQRLFLNSSLEQGLTLVECVIAILVVNLALIMLTAPLVMVTATRLQNDRINQASQLARSEIDRLRLMLESGATLPPVSTITATIQNPTLLDNQPPPNSVVTCPASTNLPSSATESCLRIMGNRQYAVQIYRGASTSSNHAYPVQVRVYDAGIINNSEALGTAPLTAAMTNSISIEQPLVVLTAIITKDDSTDNQVFSTLGSSN